MRTSTAIATGFCALLLGYGVTTVDAFAQAPAPTPAPAAGGHHSAPAKPAAVRHAAQKPAADKKAEPAKAAQQAPAEPPRDVTTRFENWTVNCAKKQQPTDPSNCVALIPVARDKTDQRKIVIMGVTKRGDAFTFFTHTPTAVDIKSGVEIQFEGRAPRHFDFGSCEPALCTVSAPLDNPLLDELLNVPQVSVTWTSLSVGQAKVAFATTGARPALEFLRAQ